MKEGEGKGKEGTDRRFRLSGWEGEGNTTRREFIAGGKEGERKKEVSKALLLLSPPPLLLIPIVENQEWNKNGNMNAEDKGNKESEVKRKKLTK